MIHIGRLIKQVFDRQPKSHTIVWFAGRLNCRRGNIYNIFNRATIDTELLIRISQVLSHDFFKDISEQLDVGVPDVQNDRTDCTETHYIQK